VGRLPEKSSLRHSDKVIFKNHICINPKTFTSKEVFLATSPNTHNFTTKATFSLMTKIHELE
ncbi:hypothetical protein IGI04_007587, partial [Brassica rapa subsp. trilocularis]